jgi:hypothetical protein
MGRRSRLAAGVAAVGLTTVWAATPAAAAELEDEAFREVTFDFSGADRTCLIGGTSRYEYPRAGIDGEALIGAATFVEDDPACREAVFEISLLGTYETAPDSGRYRSFSATSGVGAAPRPNTVATQVEVAGPTGPVHVEHEVTFVCGGASTPMLCSFTVATNPK